jgi:hypothetical protein
MMSVIGETLCITFFQVCGGVYRAWWSRSILTVAFGQRIIAFTDVTVRVQQLQVSLNRDTSSSSPLLASHASAYSFPVDEIQC